MNLTKKNIILIVVNSALLGAGILGIFIPNIITGNWYSLLTIFMFSFSVMFPAMCNALEVSGDYSQVDAMLFDDEEDMEKGKCLSWLLLGMCIAIGYAIPFLLWRNKEMPALNMGLAMGGGTVILTSIAIFIKYVLLTSSSS